MEDIYSFSYNYKGMQLLEYQLQYEDFQYNNLFQEIKRQFLSNTELEYISVGDFEVKRISSKEAFASCLQNICYTIDQRIIRILANVEATNHVPVYEFDALQDECRKLKLKLNLFEAELIELGYDLRDYEVIDFYKPLNSVKKVNLPNPNIKQLTKIEDLLTSLTPLREPKREVIQNTSKNNYHPNIFKDGSFAIWSSMFDDFEIKESSRTDVKFMFEIMKRDGLIYNTVREVDFLNWINRTYQIAVQKISYADLNNSKRNITYHKAKALHS